MIIFPPTRSAETIVVITSNDTYGIPSFISQISQVFKKCTHGGGLGPGALHAPGAMMRLVNPNSDRYIYTYIYI